MAGVKSLDGLRAWQTSLKFTRAVYTLIESGVFTKDFELEGQLREASRSAVSQIAEGYGRFNPADVKARRTARRELRTRTRTRTRNQESGTTDSWTLDLQPDVAADGCVGGGSRGVLLAPDPDEDAADEEAADSGEQDEDAGEREHAEDGVHAHVARDFRLSDDFDDDGLLLQ